MNAEEARAQRDRLAQYRSNLAHLLRQTSSYGGADNIPVKLFNDIAAQRQEIARIKGALRAAGLVVVDQADDSDTPSSTSDTPSPPATGTIHISGGTIYGPVIGTNTGDIQGGNYTFGDKKQNGTPK